MSTQHEQSSIISTSEDEVQAEKKQPSTQRKPYQKPGFVMSQAFERQALSCAGCLNQSAAFPNFCAMRS